MPVLLAKEFIVLLLAALGFITLTTSSIIIHTQEGEKLELNYEELTEKWKGYIEEELSSNPDEYVKEYFDGDRLRENTFTQLIRDIESEHEVEVKEKQKEELFEKLDERLPASYWDGLEQDVRDNLNEQESYRKDSWKHNGLEQSDFYEK